jgi:hypothetical protein
MKQVTFKRTNSNVDSEKKKDLPEALKPKRISFLKPVKIPNICQDFSKDDLDQADYKAKRD